REAYLSLNKKRAPQKKVYALNNYLYYLVEGAEDSNLRQMVQAAETLSSFAEDRSVWQYRFDDTLARYFHRMATTKQNEVEWKDSMEAAKLHIEKALRRAH